MQSYRSLTALILGLGLIGTILWRLAAILNPPVLAGPPPRPLAIAIDLTGNCAGGVGNVSVLTSAIHFANTIPGDNTIILAPGCVYTLTTVDNYWYGPNGLPAITSTLTISGNGATLVRDPALPRLRFFYIVGNLTPGVLAGNLTLHYLTLQGGLARGGNGATRGGGGAGMGGAIFNQGDLTLDSVTLAGNTVSAGAGGPGGSSGSAAGGAIYSRQDGGGAANITLKNSLLVNTSGGMNCANTGGGAFTSTCYNLAGDNTCNLITPGDLPSTDPGLGPLANNGGSVQTHALLAGSPAFNAGDSTFAPPPDFDQRGSGFPRLLKGRLDIGAYESSQDVLVNLVLSKQVAPGALGPGQPLTYTLTKARTAQMRFSSCVSMGSPLLLARISP